MNPSDQNLPMFPIRKRYVVLLILMTMVCIPVIGVTGYFRLSSETKALRESFVDAQTGEMDKKIALSVGWFTTSLVRLGVSFAHVPPEARAALESVHSAD